MKRKNKEHEFWVTNISNTNITLADLQMSFPAKKTINLLGKNFNFTIEQLEKSAESGSLFERRNMLYVRNVPPQKLFTPGIHKYKGVDYRVKITKTAVKLEEVKYEELQLTDEEFAMKEAELEDDA